ncbi:MULTISPECIES: response regulator [unclassified Paenibacillus]|uniref:response regulator n=1 Tax=unclassified Paenibacillus TaxID=185978 RepID=UPI001C10D76B|nr:MULTISPECIES: response regulator [unclassified Paenibacillus]MBU5441943.1 response regulator [Paenibacillus sp. MSJ-34]CAH0121858.1 Protein-glutamate methylesterase/protein-glutamine glutaminase [Paenibacillus sp. CECT 9249]
MFQVMLIDDEPLVHNDLGTLLDWRKHGFEICGEAYNGAMALTMIEQSPPHIAIIDVNMPDMNGVELHRTIRDRFPSVKTIMLSSYDDYDYVRESLKNGAVDYLLKHRLDDATLLTMLNKAVRDLQQEDRMHESRAAHKQLAERMSPVLIRDYIADLVRGKADAATELEAYARKNGLYAQAVGYAAAAVQIVPFLLLTKSCSDVQTNRLVQQAVDMMQQGLGDIHERSVAYMGDGRLVVVFSFKERSEHAAASEAGRLMSKLRHSLELFLNLKCIYAVGHVCGSLPQLGSSYRSAERALDLPPSAERSAPHRSSEKPDQAEGRGTSVFTQRVSLTIEEQKQLLLAIERLDKEGMHRLIASVFVSIRHQPIHSHTVQMVVGELLHIGDKAWKRGMPTALAEAVTGELPSRSDLGKIDNIGELEQWLQRYYDCLLKLLRQQRAIGPYSRHVSQAIDLILEKYPGYITLELAAGAIGLNPSYLSRIFKEETQSTFSEYVNRVRIEASRKLLESGQYTIKQVSGQVGFSTHNYFFKVFKEVTGMTPHAYLNGLGGGKAE